ncbi:hypothetical protein R3X27_03545 [Tropicimonas sp. TH_r6]|uniref:hypothetical protein n=1 Tax=Tropicimonas sp. TH_r6 TaxID=3082085 RepID=UPI00295461EE|nr:hypothetical protein [Tropicimonas sp. TH_r6]MDV7141750.1 hypothetical protein [Tropicimonas sp. TH_r6]
MPSITEAEPKTFEEALEVIQTAPTLRKIKSYLDNTALSADMKALLYDVAKVTVKIGERVVAIGRYVLSLASALMEKYPSMLLAAAVGLVLVTLTGGVLGSVPVFGAIAVYLSKIAALIGVAKGYFEDLRQNVAKSEMDRVAAQFAALNMGVVQQ